MTPNSINFETNEGLHQDLIVDGKISHVLEVCRRFLRAENALVRLETAHFVLERLRMNQTDSKDDVNALLRLLSNHVSPTKDFTEEVLSFLYFSEHRILLIHHLSKVRKHPKTFYRMLVLMFLMYMVLLYV
jgi:type IV secretory pathway component VirB8